MDVYFDEFADTEAARQAAPIEREVANEGRAKLSVASFDGSIELNGVPAHALGLLQRQCILGFHPTH